MREEDASAEATEIREAGERPKQRELRGKVMLKVDDGDEVGD
jgi:hypothetical protein